MPVRVGVELEDVRKMPSAVLCTLDGHLDSKQHSLAPGPVNSLMQPGTAEELPPGAQTCHLQHLF